MPSYADILHLTDDLETPERKALPDKDQALFREMLDAWVVRRVGSLHHREKSVGRDLSVLIDMATFTGKAPWFWSEDDFDQWNRELGMRRKLAVTTQRHYQSVIRKFLEYIANNVKFRNDVRREYGVEVVQICHSGNCIPHTVERELVKERPAFTHDQIALLFDCIDEEMARAYRFNGKDFRPLQRDKTMFYLMYVCGLRISETRGLNITSFQPNPSMEELGEYGMVGVWGKGSRGSGPRYRLVPVTHIELPPLLEWYLDAVRPWFLRLADPNEEALFLSERGRRIALSTMEARFQHVVALAGLENRGFSPHCLRHTSVTHESQRMSLEANRLKHGHAYAATTQGYTHTSDEYVDEEIRRALSSQIDGALAAAAKRGKRK